MDKTLFLIKKLSIEHKLNYEEWDKIISAFYTCNSDEIIVFARDKARKACDEIYGNKIYIRGLIEISNFCKNNCKYCGIRRDNNNVSRYRLSKEEILKCAKEGHELGFRTFVFQGGEDVKITDDFLVDLIEELKAKYDDTAITLSLGERSKESYKKLFDSGANRYLIRHETYDENHYKMLHYIENSNHNMSYSNRINCLKNLKEIGYQVGTGMMINSPYQTKDNLIKDLIFIQDFNPHMVGIGPFIPHKETEFKNEKAGSVELTCYLISLIRLIKPNALIPATTSLVTLDKNGRKLAIQSGANVIMPNLSPKVAKDNYSLYDGKANEGLESAKNLSLLKESMKEIGYEIIVDRGDII